MCRGGHAGGSHSGTGGGRTSSHAGGTCSLEGNNASESVRDLVPEPSILQSMRMFERLQEEIQTGRWLVDTRVIWAQSHSSYGAQV